MTVLTADQLADAHPMLPSGWQRSMTRIRRGGGPWTCKACGGPSYLCYRCSACGKDLAGKGSAEDRRRSGQR